MSTFIQKIAGTSVGSFIIGLTGVKLKNTSGNLEVRNNADTAYADITGKDVTIHGGTYGVKLTANASQAADYALTLPVDDGSVGQVLSTDGSGALSWVSAASTASDWKADSTSFAFGSGTTVTAFTLPANAIVDRVSIIVDTAFDAGQLSVGVNGGSASIFAGAGDSLLTHAGRYDIPCAELANVSSQDIELYFSAGGATVGAGRVLITYAVPS